MSEENKNAATPKDALFFQTILCSMKNKPDVDWAIVAEKSGYKDAKTASTRYGQIMKKLTGVSAGKAMSGSATGSSKPSTPTKKMTGTPKKAIGSGTNGNAMKVTKARASKKDLKVGKFDEDEEDERFERMMDEMARDGEIVGGVKKEVEREVFVDAEENVEA